MRTIIHLGAFLFALVSVSQASADEGHRRSRQTVIHTKPAKHGYGKQTRPTVVYTSTDARALRNLRDDRRDLQELVSISAEWKRAVRRQSKRAQAAADRRLHAWLYREIEESRRESPRDLAKTRAIARELRQIDWRFRYNYARPGHYAKKRQLLNELVQQAKFEVERDYRHVQATNRYARSHRPVSYVYAY